MCVIANASTLETLEEAIALGVARVARLTEENDRINHLIEKVLVEQNRVAEELEFIRLATLQRKMDELVIISADLLSEITEISSDNFLLTDVINKNKECV